MAIAHSSSSYYCRLQNEKNGKAKKVGRIFISTNPSHIDLVHLRDLFASSNLSCHRFPNVDSHGHVEAVDPHKLGIALSHSSVVVSVFSKPPQSDLELKWWGWFDLVPNGGELVGFGRAISDTALTASIHDVMVMPSLQRLGIGRMIVNKILRTLTSRGIYDISALCCGKQRLFFEACGFGDDILQSTTMMYTRAPSGRHNTQNDQTVKSVGRMSLLVPPSRETFPSDGNAAE